MKIKGETATFNCTVDGNPEPSIDWTKDNVALNITADPDLSQSNSGKVHLLEIQNVYRSDEGQYRCVANNSIGSATSEAGSLSVHCKYYLLHWQYCLNPCKGIRILESVQFLLWNPVSWALESRIQLKESGILLRIGIKYLEYGINGMESRIQDCPSIAWGKMSVKPGWIGKWPILFMRSLLTGVRLHH